MKNKISLQTVKAGIKERERILLQDNQIAIWWLGQAGFLMSSNKCNCIIDPYLSNSLAQNHPDGPNARKRMMPIPIEPSQLKNIGWIFSSHAHSDHMDVGTIPFLIDANPSCKYFAPRACKEKIFNELKIDSAFVKLINSGDKIQLTNSITVDVIAAAHEELKFDEQGDSLFLGFIFSINGIKIYHSGDCTPYDGLTELIKKQNVDIALLPVNGRDEARLKANVMGNFHFEEAVDLCVSAGIKYLIPHHFGLFEFNTVDPAVLQQKINSQKNDLRIILPEIDKALVIDI